MKRGPHGIALNLKTLTTKVPGITLDTNGPRRITQGLAGVGPSRLSKVARNISSRNPNTRIVRPRAASNSFLALAELVLQRLDSGFVFAELPKTHTLRGVDSRARSICSRRL